MNNSPTPTISKSDRIPLKEKLCFAAGVNMDYASTGLLIGVIWMQVFNIGFGINPVVVGFILMGLRAWDAFVDPVVGYYSDQSQSRWGRRRPYMIAGAIGTAAIYPLFWHLAPAWPDSGKIAYVTIVGILFFSAFATWSMPYYGMQMELTPDYDERTRLTFWMALFGKIFWLFGGWVMAFIMYLGSRAHQASASEGASVIDTLLATISHLQFGPGGSDSAPPIVLGMRLSGWLIALSILAFGLLPAIFVRERNLSHSAVRAPRQSFWKNIRESANCRPLWILIGVSFFISLGTTSVAALGQYVNIYYVNQGDLAQAAVVAGWKNSVAVVVGIVTLPLFAKIAELYDKKVAIIAVITCAITGHAMNYWCLTPENPYLQILSGVFETCALGAIWMFLPSMKADVADYDELATNRRREGSLNAFYSWFIKLAGTLSVGLGGWVLYYTGFDAKAGAQADAVTHRMFVIYLIAPIIIWLASLALMLRYPITRQSSAMVRKALEKRRREEKAH